LERLEYLEDFLPDVVVVDYADILRPEDARLEGRERIAETWMMLKNLAQTRHCLSVTASQTTRDAIDKKNLTQKDTPEDIRKNAIADVIIPLNQTQREKRMSYLRVGLMVHRHREVDEFQQIHVLQQLKLGQPLLDSEYVRTGGYSELSPEE
jgi:replicative DNA helicase